MRKTEIYAYMGKTLRINLSSKKVSEEDYSSHYADWLGGLAVKILYDELPDWVTPYDVRNKIILSVGALIGTLAPGACKMSAATLGPITGGWAYGAIDSYVGMELKHAGYDHLIIEGRANKPCYLWITDGAVEIRDASNLWGKTTWDTLDSIREELQDPSLHILSIGPAGENMARGACIIQDRSRALGRCGTGSVMGSKNLKAIVCKGKKPIKVADKERFNIKVHELRARISESAGTEAFKKYGSLGNQFDIKQKVCAIAYKNFQDCSWPDDIYKKLDLRKLIDKYEVAKQGFPGCALCCGRHLVITEGPYKGLSTEANQWEMMGGLMAKLAVEEPTFAFKMNAYCNQMGMDIDSPSGAIGWAMECYEKGILSKEDTDGLEITWGDEKVILELTRKMCYREGFGDILSEGCARASTIIGRDSEKYAMQTKNQDLYETLRGTNGWALGTLVSTRGGGHTTGAPWWEHKSIQIDDENAQKLLGISNFNQARITTGYEGKPDMVYQGEILSRICNSTGICLFNTVFQNFDYINLHDFAELLSAASGQEYTIEDLEFIAMRQLNLEKAFNLRFTNYTKEDDMPQPRNFDPVPSGTLAGWQLDKRKFEIMLEKYYTQHGWDIKTSYPTRETLEKYGLSRAAIDLEKIGKLGRSFSSV